LASGRTKGIETKNRRETLLKKKATVRRRKIDEFSHQKPRIDATGHKTSRRKRFPSESGKVKRKNRTEPKEISTIRRGQPSLFR